MRLIWLSVDPLYYLYPAHTPYNYVMNNPVNLIDPTGMSSEEPGLFGVFFQKVGNWVSGKGFKTDEQTAEANKIEGVVTLEEVKVTRSEGEGTSSTSQTEIQQTVDISSRNDYIGGPGILEWVSTGGIVGGVKSLSDAVKGVKALYSVYKTRRALKAAGGVEQLMKSATQLRSDGLTNVGHALQKHGIRPGSVFSKATGSPSAINSQGEVVLRGILSNPNATTVTRHHARFGNIMDIQTPGGQGARFSADGKRFIHFLEP